MRIFVPAHDNRMNIGAKGLSGEGYKGHCFWDTEIFLLPYYIFTDPDTARKLVEYRYLSLPGAHRKARENGYKGAMFPWESADTGAEECPVTALAGTLQHHITADVAIAAWNYYRATQDRVMNPPTGFITSTMLSTRMNTTSMSTTTLLLITWQSGI